MIKKQFKKILFSLIVLAPCYTTIQGMEKQAQQIIQQEATSVWIKTNDGKLIEFASQLIPYSRTLIEIHNDGHTCQENAINLENISSQAAELVKNMLSVAVLLGDMLEEEKAQEIAQQLKTITIPTALKVEISYFDCSVIEKAFILHKQHQSFNTSVTRKRKREDNRTEHTPENNTIIIQTSDGEISLAEPVAKQAHYLRNALEENQDLMEEDNATLFIPSMHSSNLEKIAELLQSLHTQYARIYDSINEEQQQAFAHIATERTNTLAKLQPLSQEEQRDIENFEKLKKTTGPLLTIEEHTNNRIVEKEITERKQLASLSQEEKNERQKSIEAEYTQKKAEIIKIFKQKLFQELTAVVKNCVSEKNLSCQELIALAETADFLDCPECLQALIELTHETLTKNYKEETFDSAQLSFNSTTIEKLIGDTIQEKLHALYIKEPVTLKIKKDICAIFENILVINTNEPIIYDLITKTKIELQTPLPFTRYTNFQCAPHKKTITALADNGHYFVIWDMQTGNILNTLSSEDIFKSFHYQDDENIMFVFLRYSKDENGITYNNCQLYNYSISDQHVSPLATFASNAYSSLFSFDWSSSGNTLMHVHNDFSNKHHQATFSFFHNDVCYPALSLAHQSRELVYAYTDIDMTVYDATENVIKTWDIKTGKQTEMLHNPLTEGTVVRLALSPDGKTIALLIIKETSCAEGPYNKTMITSAKVALFDRQKRGMLKIFDIFNDFDHTRIFPEEFYFSPDNKNIFIAYSKGFNQSFASFWNLETEKRLLSFDNYRMSQIAPDGSIIIVQSNSINEPYVEKRNAIEMHYGRQYVITVDYIYNTQEIREAFKQLSFEQALFLQTLPVERQLLLTQKEYELYQSLPELLQNLAKVHILLF